MSFARFITISFPGFIFRYVRVGSLSNKFRLEVGDYSGTAGNGLNLQAKPKFSETEGLWLHGRFVANLNR